MSQAGVSLVEGPLALAVAARVVQEADQRQPPSNVDLGPVARMALGVAVPVTSVAAAREARAVAALETSAVVARVALVVAAPETSVVAAHAIQTVEAPAT